MSPIRVQRERRKGWRMPQDTVSVARPGRWGNPFTMVDLATSLALYETMVCGGWTPDNVRELDDATASLVYRAQCAWRERLGYLARDAARFELRGRNLACWCPLGAPCHADILLRIANE